MDYGIGGRIALVVGGSKGIGLQSGLRTGTASGSTQRIASTHR